MSCMCLQKAPNCTYQICHNIGSLYCCKGWYNELYANIYMWPSPCIGTKKPMNNVHFTRRRYQWTFQVVWEEQWKVIFPTHIIFRLLCIFYDFWNCYLRKYMLEKKYKYEERRHLWLTFKVYSKCPETFWLQCYITPTAVPHCYRAFIGGHYCIIMHCNAMFPGYIAL